MFLGSEETNKSSNRCWFYLYLSGFVEAKAMDDDGLEEKIDQISCDSYNRLQLFMRQIKVNNGSEYWLYRVL